MSNLENDEPVFKVLTEEQYAKFNEMGEFKGSEIDIKDGFIHMSKESQLERILNKYFAGQDVVIAEVNFEALKSEIKWEPASNGDLFPHLYRPLQLSEVVAAETHSVG